MNLKVYRYFYFLPSFEFQRRNKLGNSFFLYLNIYNSIRTYIIKCLQFPYILHKLHVYIWYMLYKYGGGYSIRYIRTCIDRIHAAITSRKKFTVVYMLYI